MIETKDEIIRVMLVDDDEDDYLLTKCLFDEFKKIRYELVWESDRVKALYHFPIVDMQ